MSKKMKIPRTLSKRGLYLKLLVKIYDFWNTKPSASKKEYLERKEVNLIASRLFCVDKNQTFETLKIMEEFGYISFLKAGKIQLNYEVVEND